MEVRVERTRKRTIVALKVAIEEADTAAKRLALAPPLHARGADPQSLWLGPGHWLITSDAQPAAAIVEMCSERLAELVHLAADRSDGFSTFELHGTAARELLTFDSGFDFRPASFEPGRCCRTRLAQVAAIVVSVAQDELEILVDRSLGPHLHDWLLHSSAPDTGQPGKMSSYDTSRPVNAST